MDALNSMSKIPGPTQARKILTDLAAQDCRAGPRKVDRPLALCGAGNLGRMAKEYFDLIGQSIAFVVDANAEQLKEDPCWKGVELYAPDAVSSKARSEVLLALCVVTAPYEDLYHQLASTGWKDVVPFYDIAEAYKDKHPLGNGWFASALSEGDIDNIVDVLAIWGDDISRAHHLQFIAWRCLRQEWSFQDAPVTTGDRFFIPEVMNVLTDNESFADVGAHTGTVVEKFINSVNGKFDRLWAIEPDEKNLADLRVMQARQPANIQKKIDILPKVVDSDTGKKYFYQGLGYASQLSNLGQGEMVVVTIDSLSMTPSIIKLHLEGAELDVLKGSLNTIVDNRPIVMATTYHNQLGFWETPKWLMGNLVDYVFYMRIHSWFGTGAVVYCIPKERA